MNTKIAAALLLSVFAVACSNAAVSGDEETAAATGSAQTESRAKTSLSCVMYVGSQDVKLKMNAETDSLEATLDGFDVAIFSRVQPSDPQDFSLFQVDLTATVSQKPVARGVGTIGGLVELSKISSNEILHFMNTSRDTEVVVNCDPK